MRVFFLMWLGASAISGVNANIWGEYIFEAFRVFLYFMMFVFFSHFVGSQGIRAIPWIRSVVVFSIVLVIIGAYQYVHYHASVSIHEMKLVTGTMSNKNLFSEYLVLLVPFLVLGLSYLRSIWRVISGIALVGCLVFIMILLARSAWITLVVLSIFSAIIYAFSQKHINLKKYVLGSLIALITVFLVIVIVDYFTAHAIYNRALTLINFQEGTVGLRLTIWEMTLGMVKDNPLLGVGVGNWKIAFQEFGLAKQEMFIAEPLNDYVGVLAESGVFGLIGYAGILTTGIITLVKRGLENGTENRGFTFAIAASLAGFAITSFFNFSIHRVEHSLVMIFCLAVADQGKVTRYSLSYNIVKPIIAICLILLSCVAGYIGITRFKSEMNMRLALEARKKQQWREVLKMTDVVNQKFYPIEPSTTPVAWYRGLANFQLGNTDEALYDFLAAHEVNPYHIHVINNMATCYALKGNLNKAIDLYQLAIERNDQFPDAVENLLAIYMHQHEYEKAYELINATPLTEYGPGNIESRLQRARKRLVRSGKVKIKEDE